MQEAVRAIFRTVDPTQLGWAAESLGAPRIFKKEADRGDNDVVKTDNQSHMQVLEAKIKVDLTKFNEEHDFFFDEVLDEEANN